MKLNRMTLGIFMHLITSLSIIKLGITILNMLTFAITTVIITIFVLIVLSMTT
jgi:hypothetical protein